MKTGIKVGDVMTRDYYYCDPETQVLDAVKKMSKNRTGSLVVKIDDRLAGIITERDILWALAKKENLKGIKVKEIMTKKVVSIAPSKDIYEAILKMRRKGIRRLPVIEKNRVIGLITWKDVVKVAPTLFDVILEQMKIKEETEKLRKAGKEEEYYEEYLK